MDGWIPSVGQTSHPWLHIAAQRRMTDLLHTHLSPFTTLHCGPPPFCQLIRDAQPVWAINLPFLRPRYVTEYEPPPLYRIVSQASKVCILGISQVSRVCVACRTVCIRFCFCCFLAARSPVRCGSFFRHNEAIIFEESLFMKHVSCGGMVKIPSLCSWSSRVTCVATASQLCIAPNTYSCPGGGRSRHRMNEWMNMCIPK